METPDVLPFLALLGVTLLWLVLPLLPALRELLRPTDITALTVVDRSSGYVAYFARNFRQYIDKQMKALPAEALAGDYLGKFPDGTQFIRVHKATEVLVHEAGAGAHHHLVVIDTPRTLPAGETYLMEVFARAPLTGGARSVYRAICADRELALGEGSTVLRWAHAGGRLTVEAHSVLRGRISSDSVLSLGGDVVFEKLGAPVICVGEQHDPPPDLPAVPQRFKLPESARQLGDHMRIEGDLEIPAGMLVTTSLVVSGRLRLGLGAIVTGSVKAHRNLELANEAQVTGAAVSGTRLLMGNAAWIGGPAIAEDRIRMGRGAVVGGPGRPATVSAPDIELATGATVYGQVSAMRGGRTF